MFRSRPVLTGFCAVAASSVAVLYSRGRRQYASAASPKTVVITGAASGLGRQTALLLLERGDSVVACDVMEKQLAELRESVSKEQQARLFTKTCNVTNKESVEKAAEETKKEVGDIDAVVNFAGVLRVGPLVEIDDRDFTAVMDINVAGTWRMNRYFFPLLQPKNGRIINISSEVAYAKFPQAFNGPYCMSKIALDAYSTALRQELSKFAMPVITIYSGAMKTPLLTSHGFSRAANKEGTQFARELRVVENTAEDYMRKHGGDPMTVSETVYEAVHSSSPKNSYLVGVSMEMKASRLAPQWALDLGMKMTLKYGKEKK